MVMPYNNSEAITDKECYTGISRLLNVTTATVRKYWEDGFYEFFVRELWLKGSLRIPHLGTFTLKHMDESFSRQKDKDGNDVIYRIPERDIPVFVPHDDFINDVNFQGVTKKYRKRAKAGKLTYHDYKREQRAQQFGEFGSMNTERIEKSKQEFKELLEKKKQEKDGES